jgi:nitrous oxidase accessory protein
MRFAWLTTPYEGFRNRKRILLAMFVLVCVAPTGAVLADELPSFQALVDALEEGEILSPPAGVYAGPVLVSDPITIDGRGEVTIDNQGKGTVILLDTDGATIKGLHLTNSGSSANDLDAGVQVRGNFNVIKDNVMDEVLFGVDLQQSNNNIVRRNQITSIKRIPLGQKGDSVRLWYSFDNKIQDNTIDHVRDMVVWYSADNVISGNKTSNSRYSLHFMYSRRNLVENNNYYNNTVGIFLMYSDGVTIRNNLIRHAAGPTGVGIGFKETSDLVIEDNQILYCATGLYIDVSPFQPDTINIFENNLIAYNGIGIRFLNPWHGNEFRYNNFAGNLTQITVGGRGNAMKNIWEDNYWSDYEGFDRDGNHVGDTPYKLTTYADRIWQDVPYAQFFKGSPVLEVLDFLERLAPFSEPKVLVEDRSPQLIQHEKRAAPVKEKNALQLLLESQQS